MSLSSINESEQGHVITGLSTDRKPLGNEVKAGTKFIETDTGSVFEFSGTTWTKLSSGGAVHVADGFKMSSYAADLTMDGTAQAVPIAAGNTRLRIANLGATTEAIRVSFGISGADADTNLTIVSGAATTGIYIPAAAEGSSASIEIIGIPSLATNYAVGNAVAADTQKVNITQGV